MRRSRLWIIALLFFLVSCAGSKPQSFQMDLAHLNDTHSHLESVAVTTTLSGEQTTIQAGGFGRLKTVIDQMRREDPELLLVHAGDAVQGTLYFTCFDGSLDFDFLNLLGVDAMTFGNHEFDRGTAPIPGWIAHSNFPWISTNIDFSREPAIAPLVKPSLIKTIHGEPVALIGVTTETTPQSTIGSGKAVFHNAVERVKQQVAELVASGINKIILLSHLGYEQDKALASQVSGIDVIVGGHSHTLLADKQALSAIGLVPEGPYPTVVKAPDGRRVLVLQAWKWGLVLGRIRIGFSNDGEITGWRASPILPVGEAFRNEQGAVIGERAADRQMRHELEQTGIVQVVPEDPALVDALKPYTVLLEHFRSERVAVATREMPLGVGSGPGPLAAASMLRAVPGAQVAVLNYGGVRKGFSAGTVTLADVLEVLPFANTLIRVDLSGARLKQTLEDALEYLHRKYGHDTAAAPYLAGASMSVQPSAPAGSRIQTLSIRDESGMLRPVQERAVYTTVVNAFVAGGHDGFRIIGNTPGEDTGIIDSDAFLDYLKQLGTIPADAKQPQAGRLDRRAITPDVFIPEQRESGFGPDSHARNPHPELLAIPVVNSPAPATMQHAG
ncbi:bifunctional metallophosphatase/5'-nucleotidase [Desulfatirhabdium butyrativorans]|uniref:bifunctional metallophosphatase/5'-nucleotidase n=1 Tax=Desulfatirhabdium butyrativorans TaxID=340467 RepID=UPI000412B56B|nr:5'-nucleotidase C-terminal domain-containing protein [Desulfatirhabdium butyrativorans]